MKKKYKHTIHRKGHKIALSDLKIYSDSHTIREMQIKTILRCHFLPIRFTIIEKLIIPSVDEAVGKKTLKNGYNPGVGEDLQYLTKLHMYAFI